MKDKNYPSAIPGENKYVDWDIPTGMWCIFGSDSGHAYASFASADEAEEKLNG